MVFGGEEKMKVRILLKQAREKKGYSYTEAAKVCGLAGRSPYFLIEAGQRTGTISSWKKIQKAFGIKDKDMWLVITTFRYIENKSKKDKIE